MNIFNDAVSAVEMNMSARKLKNSWWADFRVEGQRYRLRSPDNSRAGAASYEGTLRRRIALGQPLFDETKPAETFESFARRWFTDYVLPNNRLSEQRSKRQNIDGYLLPFFGKMAMTEINSEMVEKFKSKMCTTNLSPKTVNNILATLSRILTIAEEWGDVPRRPKIRMLRVPPQAFDYLTAEDSEKLLNQTHNPFVHGLILFAMQTGLRFGELMALDWEDIDLKNRRVTVRRALVRRRMGPTKSNRIRYIPLSRSVCATLRCWPHKTGYVFGQKSGAEPTRQDAMAQILVDACKNAGLRRLGWHALRHTFASHLVASGAHLKIVQELLGHTDLRVTMRYAHLEPSRLMEAVDRLDQQRKKSVSYEFWATGGQPEFSQIKNPSVPGAFDGGPDGIRTDGDVLSERSVNTRWNTVYG